MSVSIVWSGKLWKVESVTATGTVHTVLLRKFPLIWKKHIVSAFLGMGSHFLFCQEIQSCGSDLRRWCYFFTEARTCLVIICSLEALQDDRYRKESPSYAQIQPTVLVLFRLHTKHIQWKDTDFFSQQLSRVKYLSFSEGQREGRRGLGLGG